MLVATPWEKTTKIGTKSRAPGMACTVCGMTGADAQLEQRTQPSLVGKVG
jgi:hypothetical protein